MRVRRRLLVLAGCLALLAALVVAPVVSRLAKGEHFFRLRPTSDWGDELEQQVEGRWSQPTLDRVLGTLGSPVPPTAPAVLTENAPAAAAVLHDLLRDRRLEVRVRAADTLVSRGVWSDEAFAVLLEGAWAHPNEQAGAACLSRLRTAGPAARSAVPELKRMLREAPAPPPAGTPWSLRAEAAYVLHAVDPLDTDFQRYVRSLGPPPPERPGAPSLWLLYAWRPPERENYQPVALVRAVNHLRSLGQREAVQALQRFLADAPGARGEDNLADETILREVVPLLFEPADTTDTAVTMPPWLKVEDGIPFHCESPPLDAGWDDGPRLLDWAERLGRLRREPLRLGDDPLAAAERLYHRLVERGYVDADSIGAIELREELREQARRMVESLVGRGSTPPLFSDVEKDWQQFRARFATLGVRWDEQKQDYVATR